MVHQDKTPKPDTEEKEVYLTGRIPETELQDWLNERAKQGYRLERVWMVTRSPGTPIFSVLMKLADA